MRIDWRPSRLAQRALLAIALLALFALSRSDLPLPLSTALAGLVFTASAWELRRMRRQPTWSLVIADAGTGDGEWCIDGQRQSVHLRAVHLREPIIGIRFDPHGHPPVHALWWPDTLDAETRRSLLLLARETIAQRHSTTPTDPI